MPFGFRIQLKGSCLGLGWKLVGLSTCPKEALGFIEDLHKVSGFQTLSRDFFGRSERPKVRRFTQHDSRM